RHAPAAPRPAHGQDRRSRPPARADGAPDEPRHRRAWGRAREPVPLPRRRGPRPSPGDEADGEPPGHGRSREAAREDPVRRQLRRGETIMNGVFRDGPQVPVHLTNDDFQVYKSEQLTTTATVLMLDLSWSMALRGSFQAAKKVALALHNLIRTQFPKDSLYLIGFSAYARELKPDELPYVRWDESVLGTNMHHALMMAQKMLAKHSAGTKQVIMISDGEPTAHLEHGRSYFAYPPSP